MKTKLTTFEKELLATIEKIKEYKLACEASVVGLIYQNPDLIHEVDLSLNDFTNNIWKVYFAIADSLINVENKLSLDDVTVGLYLETSLKRCSSMGVIPLFDYR